MKTKNSELAYCEYMLSELSILRKRQSLLLEEFTKSVYKTLRETERLYNLRLNAKDNSITVAQLNACKMLYYYKYYFTGGVAQLVDHGIMMPEVRVRIPLGFKKIGLKISCQTNIHPLKSEAPYSILIHPY